MKKPLILTFDVGTQSMKAMLVNANGEIEAFEQHIYDEAHFSRHLGWAEQRADFYYEVLCSLGKIIYEKYPKLTKRIIGVTTTVFRDSTVCLDKNNKPLNDLILWLDKREINDEDNPIPFLNKMLFRLGGAKDMAEMVHNQSICNYLISKEKDIWHKTNKYVYLSTYLNYKLTGNLIDSDAALIGHMPFDYKNHKWMSKYDLTRYVYNVPKEKVVEPCDPGTKIGTITEKCSLDSNILEGLPVIVTGSDKGCETIGLSVTSENKAAISFGTSATIQFTSKKYFKPMKYCPSFPAIIKGYYNPETQIYRGYWMLTWYKRNFAHEEMIEAKKRKCLVEEVLNEKIKNIPAGCNGLVLQPFWAPGVYNPNAKGSIIGFSDIHDKYHVYKAIIEGINYGLMDGLKAMEKRGKQKIEQIYVGGGGSKSDEVCQITADMLGLPVRRIQTNQASGLGSSMLGFVSLGVYKDIDEAITKMVRVKDTFLPNSFNHRYYEKMYNEVYAKLDGKLESLFKKIKQIERRNKKK